MPQSNLSAKLMDIFKNEIYSLCNNTHSNSDYKYLNFFSKNCTFSGHILVINNFSIYYRRFINNKFYLRS